MANWTAFVTNPLGIAGVAFCFVFILLAVLKRGDQRRWIVPGALLMAGSTLAGGLGLGYYVRIRTRNVLKVQPASPAPATAQPVMAPPAVAGLNVTSDRRLWVLRDHGQIVEYDLASLTPKQTVTIPADELPKYPTPMFSGRLSINAKGQILFQPEDSSAGADAACKVWLWNGQSEARFACGDARHLHDSSSNEAPESDETLASPKNTLEVMLSADGQRLFWFANQGQLVKSSEDLEHNDAVINTFRVWETDLAGNQRRDLESFTFPQCKCETGACEETCPIASIWAPEQGVDDFFLVTHFVPGQLQSKFLGSFLYRRTGTGWVSSPLPAPLESISDAAAKGAVIIEIIPDSGCCGWANESSDQTILWRDGKPTVLFDEFERFNNSDYDVSFYAVAQLSPKLDLVAMTIASAAKAGSEIPLSDQGKAKPAELEQIQRALTGLPAVEVASAADPAKRVASLPHASFVGWLSDQEILIVEDHQLVAYNVTSGVRQNTRLSIPERALVFLR